ncbi:hypothetical protein FIBSPDRAFT_43629 [Athelia psychrophila]|uniref:DNA-directed RNA polymerase III subunit Rpc5 n=1 Tax=Athelia psychrophila TaxID=1759441 RepID=A0A166U0I7_9AGAM|nr:hypothetical protein FIBSPDRAFT_43629 [Fibularhizoctonia sp. CBS 109695]
MDGQDDPVVNVLPIHFSNTREPYLQIHQFPLLNRPLQTPPSAALSGKRIRARIKPNARRLEVHVPADTREGFWNSEKGRDHGAGRIDDDRDKNQELHKGKHREGEEPRLGEVRMRSEHIPQKGSYMLGVVRNDAISRKSKRRPGAGSDSDSDDGPPPDPDDPAPLPVVKKEKKVTGEAKEIQVSARKASDDKSGMQGSQGGLSTVRREMLLAIRTEDEEEWQDLEFCDGEVSPNLPHHVAADLLSHRLQNQRKRSNLFSPRALNR